MRQNHPRAAFTLVELLMVVVIIGILAGLIVGAANMARIYAKKVVIHSEITQLEQSLNSFKTTYGEYPLDGFQGTTVGDTQGLKRFLLRAFPRLNMTDADIGILAANLTPDVALAFWLGGINNSGKNDALAGFFADPSRPFLHEADAQNARKDAFFKFDPARLEYVRTVTFRDLSYTYIDSSGATRTNVVTFKLYRYYPTSGTFDSSAPYMYYRAAKLPASNNEYTRQVNIISGGTPATPTVTSTNPGFVRYPRPYGDCSQATHVWVKADSFQILSCGLDGHFGLGNAYPSGVAPSTNPLGLVSYQPTATDPNYNADDITNFCDGTLGDKQTD